MIPFACLIPARMESQRYPGKALAIIEDQAMVVRCAHNAINAGLKTWVCTDSLQIEQVCRETYIDVIRTPSFNTGTDRCAWAIKQIHAQHIIILQGDEPLVKSDTLKIFQKRIGADGTHSDLLFNGITELADSSMSDKNIVKASCHRNQYINTLTRSINQKTQRRWQRQMGLYGGSVNSFLKFTQLPTTPAEEKNNIEMLRWINHGNQLYPVELHGAPYSVDTPEDMKKCQLFLKNQKLHSVNQLTSR